MERRQHFKKMSAADFVILSLLGCLAVCSAAPTTAPMVSPEDENLAQVMQHIVCRHTSNNELSGSTR